jgi:RNA polymerase sigma-70 factor (ECF subfamily)
MNPSLSAAEPAADASAVDAIRAGDRDRYRELVERHADKVFAIAWCRLGDRDLAEEAAQEAFISGYRRLGLLGHTEKFGAWISAIARNAAINLGLRRRGELRKRARWALEQDPDPEPATSAADHPATAPETLRESLEALPSIHRECLVLFYLESRSIAEAAATLGISENAFKVRLHRARTVLREALQSRLESGLDQLRAPSRLTHAVMLALPTAPSGGLLALGGIASGFAKMIPFGWVLVALQIVSAIPGLLLARWMGHKEIANFREPDGFRSKLYHRFLRGMLIGVASFIALGHLAGAAFGIRVYAIIFGGVFLVSGLDQIRRLHVLRHSLHIAGAIGVLLIAVPLLGMGLFDWHVAVLLVAQGLFYLVMSFAVPSAAPRMDYSLFIRAAHELLPESNPTPSATNTVPTRPGETIRFARFLGKRLLIEDWRRSADGLELRLARVFVNIVVPAVPFYWGPTSRLILHDDGAITAQLGEADLAELAINATAGLPATEVLEVRVASAVACSRTAFQHGDETAAARYLGEEASESVFKRSPATTPVMRGRVWLLRVAAILIPLLSLGPLWFQKMRPPNYAGHYGPIAITETDVRTFLTQLAPDHTNHTHAFRWWQHGLYLGTCLPPLELFPKDALSSIQSGLIGYLASNTPATTSPEMQLGWALGNSSFLKAAAADYFSPDNLRPHRLDPDSVRAALPVLPPELRLSLLGLQEISVQGHDCTMLTTDDLALRVRFLERYGCLDLVDLSPVVPTLVACQILATNLPSVAAGAPPAVEVDVSPPGVLPSSPTVGEATPSIHRLPPLASHRCHTVPLETVHGLFQSRFGDFLRDTRDILYLLKAAHALDQIDREACIAGILRLHRGKGLFAPDPLPNGAGVNLVRCNAPNTWFAYESLRMLGALDRVPDLAQWKFRTHPGDFETIQSPTGATQVLIWPSLEAWCLQRRFMQSLAE